MFEYRWWLIRFELYLMWVRRIVIDIHYWIGPDCQCNSLPICFSEVPLGCLTPQSNRIDLNPLQFQKVTQLCNWVDWSISPQGESYIKSHIAARCTSPLNLVTKLSGCTLPLLCDVECSKVNHICLHFYNLHFPSNNYLTQFSLYSFIIV